MNNMGESKVIYVEKKKWQMSKILTVIILLLIIIAYGRGLVIYWDSIDYYHYFLEFIRDISLGVLPYFCLSMVDRINYMVQAKYQKGN